MVNIQEKLIRPSMPELDSLRGVAILLVLFFHGFGFKFGAAKLPRFAHLLVVATMPGWIGVNLFFVLSGFLITGILLDSKRHPQYYRRFYIRRALRILPAYYALLLLLAIVPGTGWFEHRQVSWQFIGLSVVYLSNVTNLFGVPMQYGALWSLAVEEHFYLLWPTVIHSLSRRAIAYCALAIVVICPILRAVAYRLGMQYGAGYTWLVADGLAIGSLLGLLSRSWLADRRLMKYAAICCITAGVIVLGVGLPFGIFLGRTFLGGTFRLTALNIFFTGVIGSTLVLGTGNQKWIVLRPTLEFFGKISYGLYLIHMLAFDFTDHLIAEHVQDPMAAVQGSFPLMCLRFGIAAAMAIGLAALSRKYFEEPFLRLKDRPLSLDIQRALRSAA
jgi:peptidoglycan/LPS O-acetylase OafA/YrhL